MAKKWRLSRTASAHGELGNWRRGQIPTSGQPFWKEVKHFRLLENEAADLWRFEWNENYTGNPCRRHTYPRQGHKFPRKFNDWELEHRYWRATPGQCLLSIVGRQPQETWWRRSQWEMLVKESQANMEAGNTAKSHTEGGAISIASFFPHFSTRELKEPRKCGPLSSWRQKKQRRTPTGVSCRCWNGPSNREGPVKEALWLTAARG